MSEPSLRQQAVKLFEAAVKAADPAAALARQFAKDPLQSPRGTLFIIAIGKAACPMLEEALRHAPSAARVKAVAVTNRENMREINGALVLPAGHPIPDQAGEIAGQTVIDLLSQAGEDDQVIALISGGGSALLPAPVEGITLADKSRVNEILLASGLDILQMNHVRQQLSRLKGGGFLRYAAPAKVEAFILSDVVGDDLRAIASGPTASPIGTRESAKEMLINHNIFNDMPESVKLVLSQPTPDHEPLIDAKNTLICSNRQSLEAMQAAALGWDAEIIADDLEGNVEDVAQLLLNITSKALPKTALLFGGETTVTLRGNGLGGRNQELALRFAIGARQMGKDWVFLSGGTDGRDGTTDAAGGLVDEDTFARIKAAGQDANALLENNDSYAALNAAGDLLITGGTGTNVADVQVFLRGPAPEV